MRKIFIPFSITLILGIFSCTNEGAPDTKKKQMESIDNTTRAAVDWQGHRGARGILPENSIPSFLKALEYPITTLELDVVVSKDKKIIVSHDPIFNHKICDKPDGTPVGEKEEILLYELTYEEIKAYDCGSRGNERFKEQTPMKVHKPSLADMVKAVEKYCDENNRERPNYNIELKAIPEGYGKATPHPDEFVKLMLDEMKNLGIASSANLQSFDINILNEINKQDPDVVVAYLIESLEGIDENLDKLNFKPDIYSPYFMLVNQSVVEQLKSKGIKLIPWTVNEPEMMKKLVELGVDGIITDYPNLIPKELL